MDPLLTLEAIHKPPLKYHLNSTPQCFTKDFSGDKSNPKTTHGNRIEALLQMQRIDPFCKHISRRLLNGKAPQHEFDTFTHMKGLLYKHVMDSGK